MRVEGSHAPPAWEPAEAACHDAARRVPFRGIGWGIRAPDPHRPDRLHALPRPLGTAGVDVTGPVPARSQDRGAAEAALVAAESGIRFSILGASAARAYPTGLSRRMADRAGSAGL